MENAEQSRKKSEWLFKNLEIVRNLLEWKLMEKLLTMCRQKYRKIANWLWKLR